MNASIVCSHFFSLSRYWLAGSLIFVFCAIAAEAQTRILVKPKTARAGEKLRELHQARGCKVFQTLPRMGGLQILQVPGGTKSATLIREYKESGLVEFAEADIVGQVAALPNDPKFLDGTLWGLSNTGQAGGAAGADIHVTEAWNLINSASNIIIAILDTGARYTHEDLSANMWTSPDNGSHGLNALAHNFDPSDDAGHGTQVAGIVGAVGNNGKGVTGVAWKTQLMACKCFNNFGVGNVSDAIICMDYAATNGARIINASFGFAESAALSNAVVSLREAGIILVAAAGNSTQNVDTLPTYPACYPLDNVVSVGYSTRGDLLAAPSNYGATNVHLVAPGEQIYSTFAATDSFYLAGNGSSFAAPYVAGALALVLARFPAEDYRLAIRRLLDGTDALPSLAGKCSTGGRLNVLKALSPPLQLTALGQASPLQLLISGGPNRRCIIESSGDMSQWSPIHTNTTSVGGTFTFVDFQASNAPSRYYRAATTP